MTEKEETYTLLTELQNSSESSQRDLSRKLNISLGKINYLLKELLVRGLISVKSFSSNPQKIKKVRYFITKKGFNARVELLHYFLKKKEFEYQSLKAELEELQSNGATSLVKETD
jgi:EPS-associated MarR family transcriptional regulator